MSVSGVMSEVNEHQDEQESTENRGGSDVWDSSEGAAVIVSHCLLNKQIASASIYICYLFLIVIGQSKCSAKFGLVQQLLT